MPLRLPGGMKGWKKISCSGVLTSISANHCVCVCVCVCLCVCVIQGVIEIVRCTTKMYMVNGQYVQHSWVAQLDTFQEQQ